MGAARSDDELRSIGRFVHEYRAARILFLAVRLELFSILGGAPKDFEKIRRTLKINRRTGEILLNALVAMGFLTKRGMNYANTARSARYLVRGQPDYFGAVLKFQDILWSAWGDLEYALRTGSPRKRLAHWMGDSSPGFVGEYIHAMRRNAQKPAAEIASHLFRQEDRMMLDVGGGSGAYALAMVEKNPCLQAVILDLPQTLALTRVLLNGHAARQRVHLQPGSYYDLRLAPSSYDVILLSHVTHNEGAAFNKKLITRCHRALRPGGRLVIHDFMTASNGASPSFAALFSVHLMTYTKEGAVYSIDRYVDWMREAGFSKLRRRRIIGDYYTPTELLFGEK